MTREKYRATLLGCAIGDTLGMPVEGWKKEQISRYVGRITRPIEPFIVRDSAGDETTQDEFGKLKYYTKGLKLGEYTDDTILTLAVVESIANKEGLDIHDIAHEHLKAYESMRQPDGSMRGGFGRTTQDALKRLQQGISPLESGVIGGPGNGPAMKMSPLGLYMQATGEYEQGLKFAEMVSRVTHHDPRSVASGVVQAAAIYHLLQGVDQNKFLRFISKISADYEIPLIPEFKLHSHGNLTSRLEWVRDNKDSSVENAFTKLGNSSNVYESYPFALFMFQKYWDDPIEGLLETVNYGGDCDTTGAIYGALCGAKNGLIFPKKWLAVLKDKERIINVADKIWGMKNGA